MRSNGIDTVLSVDVIGPVTVKNKIYSKLNSELELWTFKPKGVRFYYEA